MHSVLRFENISTLNEAISIGLSVNKSVSDLFDGNSYRNRCVSCSICDSDNWEFHTKSIVDTLSKLVAVFSECQERAISQGNRTNDER